MLGEPCDNKASYWQSRVNNIIGRVEGLACICYACCLGRHVEFAREFRWQASELSKHGFRERVSTYLFECFATVDPKSAEANGNFCFPDLMYVRGNIPVAGRQLEWDQD